MNTTFIKTITAVAAASFAALSAASADQTPAAEDPATLDNIYEEIAAGQERMLDVVTASAEERIAMSVKEDDLAPMGEFTLASR